MNQKKMIKVPLKQSARSLNRHISSALRHEHDWIQPIKFTHCFALRTSGFECFPGHSAQVYLHLVSEAGAPRHPFSEHCSVPPLSGQPVLPLGPFWLEIHASLLLLLQKKHTRLVHFLTNPNCHSKPGFHRPPYTHPNSIYSPKPIAAA